MNFFLGSEKSIAKLVLSDRGLVTSQGKTAPQKFFFKLVDTVGMDQKEGTEEKKITGSYFNIWNLDQNQPI